MLDGPNGIIDHFGAVQKGLDFQTLGQRFLDGLDTVFYVFNDGRRVTALEHHHDTPRQLPLPRHRERPVPNGRPQPHVGHVQNQDGRAVRGVFDHDLAHIRSRFG